MIKDIRFGAKQTIALGFAAIILTGALLLMLPISNRGGTSIAFIDALFTAASATCVTGLVVFDTWSQFTFFGQMVILILIQIGGLGFMTIAILFSMVLGKRIGLRERSYAMEAISSMQISGVVRLVKHILMGTLFFELIGATILSFKFYPIFGLGKGIWFGIFHSISAFCNAGFDLMGTIEPYSSLTHFSSDIIINIVITSLIVIGGIGFIVWDDLFAQKLNFKKYKLHTKVVLSSTIILIIVSFLLFMIVERNNVLAGLPFGEKVLVSMFHSITPRTAGFNTIDTAALTEAGSFLTMILMFIGASPGSTAGGIKITTFVILIMALITYFRKYDDVNIFRRRISTNIVKRSFFSTSYYLLLIVLGTFVILVFQPLPIKDTIFEVFSAIGTVGLSTGITRDLSALSRIVIVILMYSGRVGSLTIFMAVTEKKVIKKVRNPEEKVIIG